MKETKQTDSTYGSFAQTSTDDGLGRHVEEISVRGYTIVPDLYRASECADWRERIDATYERQEKDYGREGLESIEDLDIGRAPLLYDFEFARMAAHPQILALLRRLLGGWFILNVQNAIINRPQVGHHQSSWHRDLPHQNFVISRPLAVSVLFAIDEFSEATGATQLVPFTHKTEVLPSAAYIEANRVICAAPVGSAVIFDSMTFHRAGVNTSQVIRRGVNHVYTVPIIKQNYDFPRALGPRQLDAELERLLGYTSQVPLNERAWREERAAKRAAQRGSAGEVS